MRLGLENSYGFAIGIPFTIIGFMMLLKTDNIFLMISAVTIIVIGVYNLSKTKIIIEK